MLFTSLCVATSFGAFFAQPSFALPLPQDPSLPFIEVDIEKLTTTIIDAPTTIEVSAPDFTPLFAPLSLDVESQGTTSRTSNLMIASQPPSPLETVTQIITAYVTPAPTTVVNFVTLINKTPSIQPAGYSPPPTSDAMTPTPAATSSSVATSTTPLSELPAGRPPPSWSLGSQFANLDRFRVQKYAGGQSNIDIVTGIPATASVTAPVSPRITLSADPVPWNNQTDNAMQLFFPQGSINPGNKPQGGADFYATPISLDDATNVTLEYSVFMDANMDFVKGGKLPGLYGGHEGCSGGNVAESCFSTRLMWRPQGEGELYLVGRSFIDVVNPR